MSNSETKPVAGNLTARVGVVGRPEVIVPFRAAGFAVFPVEPGPDAGARVEALLEAGLSVLFYTEDLSPHLAGLIGRYSRSATPCLVMLPMGAEQHGFERLREIVRRAVGADVFGRAHAPRGEVTAVHFEGETSDDREQ
jgi:V/A-type H+-transporting ATPase subunit F